MTPVSHIVNGEIPMLQSEFDALSKRQLHVGTVRAGERDVFAKVKADLEQVACETCVRDNTAMVAKVGDLSSTSGSMHQQRTSGQAGKEEREKKKTGEGGQREEGEKGREREKGRKGERGKEKKRDAEEQECKQVKKDATGWTVVTRNKRQRKMVQIFVKVDEAKVTPMDVSLTDGKVEDVIRQVQKGEDVYVTIKGKVLRRNEKLKSCGVTDGCTIQVTSRMRGGGRHKDKRSKTDTKRGMDERGQKDQQVESLIDKCQEATQAQKDEMIQLFEENDAYRRMITMISEAEDEEHEIQRFRKQLQSGVDEERAKLMELGMRWAVEARKRGRDAEQEQRRQEEQRQRRHEQQGQNTEQEQGKTEVQTGGGSAGLVRGGDERCRTDETSRKGKGKGNGGKGEHEGKGGGFGHSGKQQEMREREEERVRMAPNMGAGGSHPQAMADPKEEEKKGVRRLRWADSEDDEGEKNGEEQETAGERQQEAERQQEQEQEQEGDREKEAEEKKEQEEGARQREMIDERPPGLEEVESESKTQGEEQSQVESEQEAQEKESGRAREQKRAQEAREEERRVQEALEERVERRAQRAEESAGSARERNKSSRGASKRREKGSGRARRRKRS